MMRRNIDWHTIGESFTAALSIAALIVFRPLLRSWYLHWGATESEAARLLPGDDLVPHPRVKYTRAITIEATPDQIWPWLVQIGQGKGSSALIFHTAVDRLLRAPVNLSLHQQSCY